MTEHYYSAKPGSRHDEREIRARLRGREYRFITDAGVFSKEHIDRGTELLIAHTPWDEASRVVDLGCGYGVIGIVAAACLPDARVFLVDPNERAVELAGKNAALNRVTNARVFCGEGFSPLPPGDFDLVVTNPPIRAGKNVMYDLFGQAHARLAVDGRLVIVIRTNQGARSAEEYLQNLFGPENVRELEKGGGFRLYQAMKK